MNTIWEKLAVISNPLPLVYLQKAGQTELLSRLFTHVLMPEAVFKELKEISDCPETIVRLARISVIPIKDNTAAAFYRKELNLQECESEAVVLADEFDAKLIVVEDAGDGNIKNRHLTGIVGIVQNAFRNGLLDGNDLNWIADIWEGFLPEEMINEGLREYPKKEAKALLEKALEAPAAERSIKTQYLYPVSEKQGGWGIEGN